MRKMTYTYYGGESEMKQQKRKSLKKTLLSKIIICVAIMIVLITQLTTMLLIGLWHGVSVNFVIWGLWHGFGLFIHQLYSRKTGAWLRSKPAAFLKAYTAASTGVTILYVVLGWIWFVIPEFSAAAGFFGRLFG